MPKILISILVMLIFCGYAAAADPDTPAINKGTIGSEIERGFSALNSHCAPRQGNLIVFKLCASKAMDLEKKSNTNIDAFSLGFYYGEWLNIANRKIAIALELTRGPDRFAEIEAPDVNRDADVYFTIYRKYQKELKVTDKELCDALHIRCEIVMPRMEEYRARVEKE